MLSNSLTDALVAGTSCQ